MIATYTPAVRTPLTFDELADILNDGLATVLGRPPSTATLSVALAKVRLESGNGQFCWNWNLGNVKCPDDQSGMFTTIRLNEVINGRVVWFNPEGELASGAVGAPIVGKRWDNPPGHPQTRMRALAGPTDGAFFYIDFVAKKTRYAKAWQALLAGNAEAYALELGKAGYYTAPIPVYTAQVVKLAQQSAAKLAGQPHDDIVVPERSEWIDLVAQIHGDTLDQMHTLFETSQREGHEDMLEPENQDSEIPPTDPDPSLPKSEPPEVA